MDLAVLGMRFETQGADTANRQLEGVAVNSGRAERASDALTASMRRQQAVMSAMKWASGLISIAALTAAFAALRKATLEYSASLAEVSTLVDTAKVSMDELSRAAIQQAGQFNSAPITQTQALYQIISAGASTAAQAIDTLTTANRLAVGGVTTVAIAADGLTSVLNAYGPRVESATAVSDAMFVAMRAGKTTIAELSASLGQVAPLAAQTGVSFDELTAATAALTKGGISTSVATAGLRAILAAVAKPSDEAGKLAAALGLEFNSAALASKGLAGFLADLSAKTGGNTDALALLFGGVEALVPVMALSGQAGQDFAAIMQDMEGKAGATGEAFDKIASGPAFQVGRIFSTMAANAIAFGNALLEVAAPAIGSLDAILQGTYANAGQMKVVVDLLTVAAIALAVRAIIPLTASIVSNTVAAVLGSNALRAYALSVAMVGPAAATTTVAVSALRTVLASTAAFLIGPWGIAIAGAVGLYLLMRDASVSVAAAMRDEAAAAGAGGQEYLRLRDAAEAAAVAQAGVDTGSRGAAGGLTAALSEAERLTAALTALGIEAEFTANKLASLGLARARSAQATAMSDLDEYRQQRERTGGLGDLSGLALRRRTQRLEDATAELRVATAVANQASANLNSGLSESERRRAQGGVDAAEAARLAAASRAAAAARAVGSSGSGRTGRTDEERDYDRLVKQSEKFVESLKEETAQIGLNSIQRKQVSIDMAAALAPTEALAAAIRAEGQAWKERAEAFERSEAIRSVVENTSRMQDQLQMMDLERDLIGATNVERARQLAMLQTELDLRRQMADIKRQTGIEVDLVNTPEGQAAIGAAGATAVASEGNRQALASYNLGLEYQLDLLRQIDDHARSAASGLADSFGETGRALGSLLTVMTSYQAQIEAISEAQRRYTETVGAGNEDSQRMAMFERDRAQAQVQQYGDMLGAAKGFFKEGSDGYRVLQAAEQAYRLFQFAMMVQSMVMGGQETAATVGQNVIKAASHGVVAVARALASLPFPFNLAAGAATIAALAAIGVKLFGGSGGGGGGGGGTYNPAPINSREDSVNTARSQASSAQSGGQAFAGMVAQSVKVEIGVNDDRFNAYVDGRAAPMVQAGAQASFSGARKAVPADRSRTDRFTLGRKR